MRFPSWIARWGSQLPFLIANMFRQAEVGGVYLPYNPDTLLQRRNLLTYTEQFDNAAWTKSNVTVLADQVIAPDGLLTADKVTVGTTGSNLVNRTVTFLPGPGGKVTGSWHWKLGDGAMPWVVFIIYGNNGEGVRAWFNLATGVVGNTEVNTTATGLAASIVPAANGFYRITLTGVFASATSVAFEVDQSPVDGAYAGAAGFNYCWGAQFESGNLTPYQSVTDWATEYMGGAPLVRRNLLTFTGQLSNPIWSKISGGTGTVPVVTDNYTGIAAPDGTFTACRLQMDRGAGNTTADASELYQTFNLSLTGAQAKSVWARTISGTAAVIMTGGNAVNLTTAWTQVVLPNVAWGSERFRFMVKGGLTPATDQTADILIWHPQLENGSQLPTAYQPITDWTTEYNADDARRLAVRSRILLWQDSTASVPVLRVEDPVGFIVDTSARYSRLGAEQFADGTAILSGGATRISAGVYRVNTAGAYCAVELPTNAAYIGKTFAVSFNIDSITTLGGGLTVDPSSVAIPGQVTTGMKRVTVVSATTGTIAIKRAAGIATDIQISNVSVREVQTDALPTGRGPVLTIASTSLTPGAGTAVDNGNGTYTVTNGGVARFFYNLTDLVQGAAYEFEVPISSYTAGGGGAQVDWCDVSQLSIAAGMTSLRGVQARASYDSTYRFLDVAAGTGSSVTVSAPKLRYLPGNHAFQPTPTARGALTARVNLLRSTTIFTVAPWVTNGTPTVTDNFATTPDGSPAARFSGATSGWGKYQTSDVTIPAGSIRLRLVLKDNGGADKDAYIGLGQNSFGGAGGDRSLLFNTVTGAFTSVNAAYTATTARSLGSGWWEVLVTALTTTSATPTVAIYTDTGSDYLVGEPDLRTADDAAKPIPAYQRVNTATDYDTTGYPHGIRLDGIDDKYLTAAFAGSGGHHTMMAAFKHLGGGAAWATVMEWGLNSPAHSLALRRENLTTSENLQLNTDAAPNQTVTVAGPFDGSTHVARYTVDTARRAQVDAAAETTAALTGGADFADSAVLGIGCGSIATTQFANIVLFGAVYQRSAAPPASFEPMRKILVRQAGMAA